MPASSKRSAKAKAAPANSDGDDNAPEVVSKAKPKGKAAKAAQLAAADDNDDDDDDEAPEEMRASDLDIQKLRELHDSLAAPSAARRRRKVAKTERGPVDRDAALDASVLDALDDDDFAQEEHDENAEEEHDEGAAPGKKRGLKIDKNARNSKKIGHITVTTLGKGDLLDAFIGPGANNGKSRPKSVAELVGSGVQRTRFGVFAAQKSRGPAKGLFGGQKK